MVFLNACDTQESELKSLRIGMNTWPGYEPFMLAKEQGFLADNVRISRLDSTTDVIKALNIDIIDVACVTLDEAMLLHDKSNDAIKIIAIIDFSTGGDAIIAKKEIASMASLKGKRIGVESSALGAFVISRSVDLTPNLHINDFQIINLGYEHHEKSFNEGIIDAVVTFEPVKTKLLQGNAHVIFDSTQIPGEIIDVMVVKEKTIKTKKHALQAMINSWFKSVAHISKQPDESIRAMASYEGISFSEFQSAYRGIKMLTLEENKVFFDNKLSNTILEMEETLLAKNLIRKKIIPKSFYNTEFLQR